MLANSGGATKAHVAAGSWATWRCLQEHRGKPQKRWREPRQRRFDRRGESARQGAGARFQRRGEPRARGGRSRFERSRKGWQGGEPRKGRWEGGERRKWAAQVEGWQGRDQNRESESEQSTCVCKIRT